MAPGLRQLERVDKYCPSCGEDLRHAPLRLGDTWCAYCGTASSLRACLRATPRALRLAAPLAESPPGVFIRQAGETFRLELSRRGENQTALIWAFLVVYAFTFGGLLLSGVGALSWVFPALYGGGFCVIAAGAVWLTWGRDTIEVDRRALVLGRSVGRWRQEEWRVERGLLRSVDLVRKPNALGRYRDLPGFILRFQRHDGIRFDFGLGHGYPQMSHAYRLLRETQGLP